MNLKELAKDPLVVVKLNGQPVTENVCPDIDILDALAFYHRLGLFTVASKDPKRRAPVLTGNDPYAEPEERLSSGRFYRRYLY